MDENIRITELKKTILENNDKDADTLRKDLSEKKIFYLNVMSSPGSGKTTLILALLKELSEERRKRTAVMEADIDSDVDAKRIMSEGVMSVQLHTGGMCHLDADMSRQGMRSLGEGWEERYGLIILENVGNLVCPAEFDTGAAKNLCLLSVPEGDDKPLKYPLMFEKADAVAITKCDAMAAFDFDKERVRAAIEKRHPGIPVFFLSAKTGEGVGALAEWLENMCFS